LGLEVVFERCGIAHRTCFCISSDEGKRKTCSAVNQKEREGNEDRCGVGDDRATPGEALGEAKIRTNKTASLAKIKRTKKS